MGKLQSSEHLWEEIRETGAGSRGIWLQQGLTDSIWSAQQRKNTGCWVGTDTGQATPICASSTVCGWWDQEYTGQIFRFFFFWEPSIHNLIGWRSVNKDLHRGLVTNQTRTTGNTAGQNAWDTSKQGLEEAAILNTHIRPKERSGVSQAKISDSF